MHPANCSSRQIYLAPKNLQILCYYASKPKFSYAATYFESFFLIIFFSKGKKELMQQQAFSNTTQQGQEGQKFAYLAKQYFASLHERFTFLEIS